MGRVPKEILTTVSSEIVLKQFYKDHILMDRKIINRLLYFPIMFVAFCILTQKLMLKKTWNSLQQSSHSDAHIIGRKPTSHHLMSSKYQLRRNRKVKSQFFSLQTELILCLLILLFKVMTSNLSCNVTFPVKPLVILTFVPICSGLHNFKY